MSLTFATRADWPKRITYSLAGAVAVLAVCALLADWSGIGPFGGSNTLMPPVAAVALLTMAVLVWCHGHYGRKAGWLALWPAVVGGQALLRAADAARDDMPTTLALGLLGSGLVLLTLVRPQRPRRRTLILATAGSAVASIGVATALGYALDLHAIYRWSLGPVTDPLSACAMVLLGLLLLGVAWRDHQLSERSTPAWLPLPVVVASATLTLILWAGLRQREFEYLGSTTQVAVNSLASTLNLELERQAERVDRIARRWSQSDTNAVVWEVDAVTHRTESPSCLALSVIRPDGTSHWVHPIAGNEYLMGLDHRQDEIRRAALDEARRLGGRVISGTLDLPTGGSGFAVYAPVHRGGELWGYVGADYVFGALLAELVGPRLKLASDYHCRVTIGDRVLYQSSQVQSDKPLLHHAGIDMVFALFDRRVRISLVPSEDLYRRIRRFLPELSLAAGFGITFLLGLTVHLARTAYSHLRASELSNTRLQAENDERRRVEAMLKVSDERLRLALDSTQIGIFEWNIPAHQIFYSPGLWTMLAYGPDEIGNRPEAWTALIHPEDLEGYRRAVERQMSGDTHFIDPEYRLRNGRGEWRWVYARARTVARAPNETPLRIIGTLQDVTERKRAEHALRESQAVARKLSFVASRTDNLVIIGTPDGRIEWVNESFTRVMEYTLAEMRGLSPAGFLIGPETSHRTMRRIAAAVKRGTGVTCDLVTYSKSGRRYHVHLELQPVRNDAGQLETYIAILTDITARVETEQALRRAKREADDASKAKSEFLASMSHEIRTPMNGVIGMTALLLETGLDLEQRDYVNTIRSSGESLLTIINDILDFSKIESGKMELEQLPFDLSVCLEEALDLFAMQAAAKRLDLGYHIEPDVPAWITGDVTRLRQVLVNLVNNAVKFTPSGAITVEVRRVSRVDTPMLPPDRFMLEIAIQDTGIGIPADRIERLFKPFSQVDSSTTRKYGGTGLGLAICQRLTQLMGGGIRVESAVNEGSRFTVSLVTEIARPNPITPLPPPPTEIQAGYVLALTPSEVTQRRFSTLFRSWGVAFQAVAAPAAALGVLRQNPAPKVVLLDQEQLPASEGARLLLRLDELRVPIVLLLTPGSGKSHTVLPRASVVSLAKPIKTASLLRSLHAAVRSETASSDARNTATRTLAEDLPLDVLLVEDNPVNQKVALRFLGRLGYRAEAVGNGLEALAVLENRHFDLILMDLQMPEMDGCETSRRIRLDLPANRQPKIVALTANALQGDRELCLAAGMDDYITKPVKLNELSDVIRRQFEGPRASSV